MQSKLNKSELEKLLTIENDARESIYGIIGRMEVLLDLFKSEPKYKNLVPFLETYYLVTKTVADKRIEYHKYYQDREALSRLDVEFASKYFEPLKKYLLHNKYQAPWKTYFKYSELSGTHPFVQMLLGINAHINADLTTCLIKLKYRNRHDFFIVNNILMEVIPRVMKFLAFHEYDIYGFGGMIFQKFVRAEFHTLVVKWRSDSWTNAKNNPRIKQTQKNLNQKTEELAHEIILTFNNAVKLQSLNKFTKNLEKLKLNIN